MISAQVGGIGFSHPVPPSRVNIYNDNSFLLSGYGDLYRFGSSRRCSNNVSNSSGTHYGCLIDFAAGGVQFWVDGEDCGVEFHDSLKTDTWFLTVTFGKGAAGARFRLLDAPR